MAKEPNITFDPATGQVVELVPQALTEDTFQANLDAAQDRLNAANEAVPSREAEYAEAVSLVETKSLELEDARKEVGLAQEEVDFQAARKAQFDEAVRLRDEQSEPSEEDDIAEAESDEVEIPVNVVEQEEAVA